MLAAVLSELRTPRADVCAISSSCSGWPPCRSCSCSCSPTSARRSGSPRSSVGMLIVAGTRLKHLLILTAVGGRADRARVPDRRDPGLPARPADRVPRSAERAGRRPLQPRPVADRGRVGRAHRQGVPQRHADEPGLRARAAHRLHLHGRGGGVRVRRRDRRCSALFALLLWRAIRIAWLAKDPFGTYVAAGIASMFAIQMFVNIGMVIGIMPITGIPLPFLSYGGTSMLVSFAGDRDAREHPHAAVHVGGSAPPIRHRNVEPSGPVCSRTTSPSIARADIRASDSPIPTPWWVRVCRCSACSSGSKIRVDGVGVDPGALVDHAHLEAVVGRSTATVTIAVGRAERQRVVDELLQDPQTRGAVERGHRGARRHARRAIRGSRAATSRASVADVRPLGQAGLDHGLEPLDEPRETLGALHERVAARSSRSPVGHLARAASSGRCPGSP